MNVLQVKVSDGFAELCLQRGDGISLTTPTQAKFTHPFDEEVMKELKWYLENYWFRPCHPEHTRAKKVKEKMKHWGEELYKQIFKRNEHGLRILSAAVGGGLDKCELSVVSDDPSVLNLPWELLHTPEDGYLALSLHGMYRTLNKVQQRSELILPPQDRLNILLVTARPYGEEDVSCGMIARSVLESLESLGDRVYFKILRPPTFTELVEELNHNAGFYHIVHFDGHGSLNGQGILVFEDTDGDEEEVEAERIAECLRNCGVQVFVLNACESGKYGKEPKSSVASQLISLGAKSVVAMSHKIHAMTARNFMKYFYRELAKGTAISKAVTASRRHLMANPKRIGTTGHYLKLYDWMAPVLYQQSRSIPLALKESPISGQESSAARSAVKLKRGLVGDFKKGQYGFIGRDGEMLKLERCYYNDKYRAVVLRGMGGVGKTELARGWGRWLVKTGGRDYVFFISFEHKCTLTDVINQIGKTFFRDSFMKLSVEDQEEKVKRHLLNSRCLLIWDNFESFESVKGLPRRTKGLLSGVEGEKLLNFLSLMEQGDSWVLITSRCDEKWLKCRKKVVDLAGMVELDASVFAREVLCQSGIYTGEDKAGEDENEEESREYWELLELLAGHPLCLGVVLPNLKDQRAGALVTALLREGLCGIDDEEEKKCVSLAASLRYSFSRLSDSSKRHLRFLGFFSLRVDVKRLEEFSANTENENGRAYRELFGRNLDKNEWTEVLQEAAGVGLVERIKSNEFDVWQFRMHPGLPWFLQDELRNMGGGFECADSGTTNVKDKIRALEEQIVKFYARLSETLEERLRTEVANIARPALKFEEPNMLLQLRQAERYLDWKSARFILKGLEELYLSTTRLSEFAGLRSRALSAVGQELSSAKCNGLEAFNLWVFLKSSEASYLTTSGQLKAAKEICKELLKSLENSNNASAQSETTVVLHNLGVVAGTQLEYDKAKNYFQKLLAAAKDTRDYLNVAKNHYYLGKVADYQEELGGAKWHYNASLRIAKEAGDMRMLAMISTELGSVARKEGRFEEAKKYFEKSLGILKKSNDIILLAEAYHHLGSMFMDKQQREEAKLHLTKALQLWKEAGDYYNAATEHINLGWLEFDEGQYENAIPLLARGWVGFTCTDDEFPPRIVESFLVILLEKVGEDKLKRKWHEGVGKHCPDSLFEKVKSELSLLRRTSQGN